ncbi:MAG: hypothetical protein IIC31_06040 [Chloroflexi bacterium]|nr:hypothetical protein [Chloroflexota bacterium]
MSTTNGHTLYLGTGDGLYLAEPGAKGYSARLAGFAGNGGFRAAVVVDCDEPETLYAGTTTSGMFRSRDAGRTWDEINAGIVHKAIWSIAQDPRTGTLFVGTSPANVFVSADRGDSWSACEGLERIPTTKGWTGPVPPHVSRLKSLALTAEDPLAVYGAIEEGWAVRSLDGGKTWEQIDNGVDHDGHGIAVSAEEPEVVVASTGKGMFRSEDRGAHFEPANEGLDGRRYTSSPLVGHPDRPGLLLSAVTAAGPGSWMTRPAGGESAFARSEDGGRTWRVSAEGLPQPCVAVPRGLAAAADDPDLWFTGMTDGTVWMSHDGARSFERVLDGLPPVMSVTVARA